MIWLGAKWLGICLTTPKPASIPCYMPWRTANRRLARERNHQAIKHRMGRLTHVPAILKLRQILRKVTGTDMDMRSVDPTLDSRPEAFNRVGRSTIEADIFMRAVIDRHVPVPALGEAKIGAQFIGVDSAAGDHVGVDDRAQGCPALVRDNMRLHVAAALQHPHNDRLGGAETADESLVDLDVLAGSAKRAAAVNDAHVFADFVAHAPGGFVGDAKLALDFFCRNAVAGGAEQKHDMEPVAQRSAGALKGRSAHGGNLIAAILA